MAHTIYLSAALFTAAEVELNQRLAEKLREEGYEVFLPQEIDQDGDQYTIFRKNVEALRGTDLVLAIADGTDVDSGVAWEMGLAYALQIPVISLRTDFRRRSEIHDSGINLMLYYGSKKYVEELTDPVGRVVEVVRGARGD